MKRPSFADSSKSRGHYNMVLSWVGKGLRIGGGSGFVVCVAGIYEYPEAGKEEKERGGEGKGDGWR